MLLKNFYRKLENLTKKHNLEWRLDRSGKIRCTRNSRCCCPITAVINIELGKRVNVFHAMDEADTIGLDWDDSAIVVEAADKVSSKLNASEKLCRAALLRATGLV